MTECNTPWNVAEVPTVYLNCVEKSVKQLLPTGVTWDNCAMMNKALKSFKDAGVYNSAVREWESKPLADQTWANLKNMMCVEYAKTHCQDLVAARATGHASANNTMEEYAVAMEEIITNLTKKYSKQIESLIKSNIKAMAKLLAAIKPNAAPAVAAAATPGTLEEIAKQAAKCKAWIEKCKTATTCPHCSKIHPNCTHSKCWELEVNASKHPAG
jgi:hypothetical protein